MAKDSIFSEKRRRGLSRLGNAVYLYILLAMVILVVLYKIWSLPFDFVVQRVVLPTSYAITSIAKSVIHPFSVFKNISSLEAENKRLENENTSLTAKLTQVNNQNEILQAAQSEAKLSQGLNFDTVKARVIGQTPYSYNQVYIINVGTNDGLKEGAGVLSNGSLIGKIFKIYWFLN